MSLRITDLYFVALSTRSERAALRRDEPPGVRMGGALEWEGVATTGEIGRPGDLPVPVGQQLRRWGALLALAGIALPGVSAARESAGGPPAVAVVDVSRTELQAAEVSRGEGAASRDGLPSGDAGDGTALPVGAPWEAEMVDADGKPLPTAPPPGPVPVDGIPAVATGPTTATTKAAAASASRADDLVPPDREYLRPILIRYAQENGLPADLVMALAWVESSWRRTAVSDAGAVGVLQLMPNTVEYVSKKLLGLRSNLDPRNATSNVRMGTKYLRHLLDQSGGNLRQALIAYNQGLTSLTVRGSYSMAERHADRVLALRPQFRSA